MTSITLYAQPKARGPLLNYGAMKQGQFQLETGVSLTGTIFTDVCDTIFKVIRMHDPQSIPSVIKPISATDTSATWIIGVASKGNKFTLKRELYRGSALLGGAEKIDNYLVTITYDGDEPFFRTIIVDTVRQLGYNPGDINDWNKFTKKTGASQTEMIEKWRNYTAPSQPSQISQPSTQATSGPTCPSCHKTVAADFAMCPYCGSKLGKPTCSNCHKEIGADFKMCPYCGTPR